MPISNTYPGDLLPFNVTLPNLTAGSIPAATFANATAWPLANLALFSPFTVQKAGQTFDAGFFSVTLQSGNYDIGVYQGSTRIASRGSTLMIAGLNVWAPAPVPLERGTYFLAVAVDNAVAQIKGYGLPTADSFLYGLKELTASFPLPPNLAVGLATRNYFPTVTAQFSSK